MSAVKIIVAAAIALAIGVSIGYSIEVEGPQMMDHEPAMILSLQGEVPIGLILPLSGDLGANGLENLNGARLGVEHVNAHLLDIGASWNMGLVVEDSETDADIALDRLESLDSRGIKLIIGPETSAAITNAKGYANDNGMIIMSCCSSAPTLAISGDNVYRLVPDDRKQGHALARVIESGGIDALIPVWRGEPWGDGIAKSTSESFASFGGNVLEGIRYDITAPDFESVASSLAEQVSEARESGAQNVGIALMSFSEGVPLMQAAATHDAISGTMWFGTGATTKDHTFVDDPAAREFANEIQYTTTQVAVSNNAIFKSIEPTLRTQTGYTPSAFAYSTYDIPWIYGLAMLQANTDDAETIHKLIPKVAERYYGALGPVKLNDAGDLETADYEIWGIVGDEWVLKGIYSHMPDAVSWN